MGVYKEGKNWKVQVYYRDWQGNRKRKQKRGFRTKGEAKEWERDFLQQQTQSVVEGKKTMEKKEKKSIHERLQINKEIIAKQQGKDSKKKGVELA